ncbi:hypothetical protein GCM10023074_60170 [Microbispora amethystogenes]|uniref:HTH IS21-type domain-containing protein n=1 Tax=Microbispora amethystogenes TaxID=1427754 RepID=A0ABQ4FN45_9ACTN|nr:hypothetical protein Mam01_64180 [Microbispora amethystogenes]
MLRAGTSPAAHHCPVGADLCDKTLAEVRSHSSCWATVTLARPAGMREQTTRERWQQIRDLLGKGVSLLECPRRLNLSLNTVKRYARTREPEARRRAPCYRPTLVDPHRDHLRERRAADPAVPVLQLFREIKELGFTGSSTCSTATSLKAGPRAIGPSSHPAVWLGSCSPAPAGCARPTPRCCRNS